MILLVTHSNGVYKFILNLNWPIIISALALILSTLSIYLNYQNTLKSMVFSKKIEIYTDYLKTVNESLDPSHNPSEVALRHSLDKQKLLVLGSKKIIDVAIGMDPVDLTDKTKLKKYYDLIHLMRKDLNKHDKTKLTAKTIDNFINSHSK